MKKIQKIFSGIFSKTDIKESNFGKYFSEVGFFDIKQKQSIAGSLNVQIKNFAFFEQALTHRSYLQVVDDEIYSNERLEFFGDSILGMIIAEFLFLEHDVLEGDLTKMRSSFVNKKSLAYCAKSLGIKDFILVSYSAEKAIDSGSNSILADAMEAIIAAIYLDSGLATTRDFILNKMVPLLTDASYKFEKNYKSQLLEHVQASGKDAPLYNVTNEYGPDHNKTFEVAVYIADKSVGTGKGKNKKSAEQDAAKNALKNLKIES